MNIFWHGQTCFKIGYQKNKDGVFSILINPFDKETGLRPPKKDCDILINSESDIKENSETNSFLINGPGEYDIKGAYIHGFNAISKKNGPEENIIYTIEAEDIKICYLGSLSYTEIAPEQLEEMGNIDILIVPVGGGEALDSKGAIKIMSQIEPKITIPMNYKVPGLKLKLDGIDNFLKALGIKSLPALPKLSIKKKDIPEEEAKIIVLEP